MTFGRAGGVGSGYDQKTLYALKNSERLDK